MTRYTNVARKRTYVQAGFDYRSGNEDSSAAQDAAEYALAEDATIKHDNPKKRKRSEVRSHGPQEDTTNLANAPNSSAPHPDSQDLNGSNEPTGETESRPNRERTKKSASSQGRLQGKRTKDMHARKEASEWRRQKRKDDRTTNTICFACREKGHNARDCTRAVAPTDAPGSKANGTSEARLHAARGKDTVGLCYRCGSRKHNLSRCKENPDPSNPLPFASCFVCSGRGHLASSCPQNQSKGIYPNGGCCKLCGETTHLAKDCALRKKEIAATTVFLGTGHDAGADEDDFHTIKRRNAEVDKSEKVVELAKRQANVKVGAHTGIVKSFAKKSVASAKKVVHF